MLVVAIRRSWRRLESVEDQVSADICCVVQVSEPDLVARGEAVDLLQLAKRIGPQCEAAEHKDLSGKKSLTLDRVVDGEDAIKPRSDNTEELSMKAPMSVSKPADLE